MFDLTRAEKRVILIVAVVLISAGLIQLFQSSVDKNRHFDYTVSDSVFSRISHQPRPVSGGKNTVDSEEKISEKDQNNRKSDLIESLININSANETELKKLPRIGPAMARRIIEYRKKNGPFSSVEELTKVKGIGKKTLKKIKPFLAKIN